MIEIDSAFETPRKFQVESIEKRVVQCDEVLSMEDVCNWLGVSERTIMRYIEEYNFPCKKVGKTRLFGKRSIIDWVNRQD